MNNLQKQAELVFESFCEGFNLELGEWPANGREYFTAGYISGYNASTKAAKNPLKIKQPLKEHFHANFS